MSVQNKKAPLEGVRIIVDEVIVNTVFDIFEAVTRLNPLQDLFKDLSERMAAELAAQSFMEFNLELTKDQREALSRAVAAKGNETVRMYLANLDTDERSRETYDIVNEKAESIADAVLSSIGREINRGAIINAVAVQANAKSEDHDEILLRKTKASGDITIPTNCLLISTNCVSVIKDLCQRQTTAEKRGGEEAEEAAPEPAGVTEQEEED